MLKNDKISKRRGGGTGKGRPRLIKTPEELWVKFRAYRKDVEANPLLEPVIFHSKHGIIHTQIRKMRPLTIRGFCSFLGITHHAWRKWNKREELQWIIELIENSIYVQKFEGVAAGLLKANIVNHELNLTNR
jgi:hypothetical protein